MDAAVVDQSGVEPDHSADDFQMQTGTHITARRFIRHALRCNISLMVACLDAKGCYVQLSGGWGWWDAKVGAMHKGHARTSRGALSEAFASANNSGMLD